MPPVMCFAGWEVPPAPCAVSLDGGDAKTLVSPSLVAHRLSRSSFRRESPRWGARHLPSLLGDLGDVGCLRGCSLVGRPWPVGQPDPAPPRSSYARPWASLTLSLLVCNGVNGERRCVPSACPAGLAAPEPAPSSPLFAHGLLVFQAQARPWRWRRLPERGLRRCLQLQPALGFTPHSSRLVDVEEQRTEPRNGWPVGTGQPASCPSGSSVAIGCSCLSARLGFSVETLEAPSSF